MIVRIFDNTMMSEIFMSRITTMTMILRLLYSMVKMDGLIEVVELIDHS